MAFRVLPWLTERGEELLQITSRQLRRSRMRKSLRGKIAHPQRMGMGGGGWYKDIAGDAHRVNYIELQFILAHVRTLE